VIDDGYAVHYLAVTHGTPVFGSDEVQAGTVDEVLDNRKEHIFDGIVIRTTGGERRFVDAPEVARTAERAVTLTITAAEVDELPLQPSKLPLPVPKVGGLFRRKKRG
jgi:hypothetical protein